MNENSPWRKYLKGYLKDQKEIYKAIEEQDFENAGKLVKQLIEKTESEIDERD